MTSASLTPAERARKALQSIFHRLQEAGTGSQVASAMGVSESTVSRIKNERLEEVLLFLGHLGYKVVPTEFKCVNPSTYEFLVESHRRVIEKAPGLIWEQEE
jgi:transcriptional regulator with XRE-family HTH domain